MTQLNTTIQNLLVIDSQVADWQSLAAGTGADTTVLILDSGADGLTQISDYLSNASTQGHPLLQSIQIISYGSVGSLQLGSSTITTSYLGLYSKQLAKIGSSLTDTGDIFLNGCNFAAGQAGLDFINQLSALTNVDVVVSNDVTIEATLGRSIQLKAITSFMPFINSATINTDWSLPGLIEITDAAGDQSTIYNITIGSTLEGQHSNSFDTDWYRVQLTQGETYSFAEMGTGIHSLSDTYLNLYDAFGTFVMGDDNSGPGYSSSITYTALNSGTYYLDCSSALSDSGQYGLSTTLGIKPSFDVPMGAGTIDAYSSWTTTPGTGTTITYGFRQSLANYSADGSDITTFTQVSASEMSAVETILSLWSDICGIHFQEVNPGGYTDNATILIGNYKDPSDGAGAFAFYPGSLATGSSAGDLWLNLSGGVSTNEISIGSWTFQTIMHELGHAIGLSHPGDYNAAPGVAITYANNAQFIQDSNQYSLMSYFAASSTSGSASSDYGGNVSSPLLFDVYETQQIYGANLTARTDNTIYGFGSTAGDVYDFGINSAPLLCIWDAGGIDTLNCSNYSDNETIDLNQGAFSSIGGLQKNITIALGAVIENAISGSGNNSIIGNSGNNTLIGGIGNDCIKGGNGDDIIDCGTGTDSVIYNGIYSDYSITYVYKNSESQTWQSISVSGSEGTDTIINAESLRFSDKVYSLNQAPIFTLFKSNVGAGDEDNQITINFNDLQTQGDQADVDGTITSFVIKGITTGSLLIGSSAGTATAWNSSNNTVDAKHQAYWLPVANTNGTLDAFTVVSKDNGGLESIMPIQTTVKVIAMNDLPSGSVTITGSTNLNEILTATNTLADFDGLGAITYQWMANGTVILGATESSFRIVQDQVEKTITVQASYTDRQGTLEHVTSASTNVVTNTINGTVGNDKLVGTNVSDILNGGKGADSMKGGLGSDTYYVDNRGDKVFERKNAGTDTVYSSISFILGANIENLTLTGKSPINGTGNEINNSLLGNAGANKISGLGGNDLLFGGLGKDKLTGGTGKDTFDFNTGLEIGKGASRDSILDFTHSQSDRVDLSGFDANSKKAGNQAFTYIDSKAFGGKAGEIHFIKGVLSGDTNGDKVADFDLSIKVVGGTSMVVQDFIL